MYVVKWTYRERTGLRLIEDCHDSSSTRYPCGPHQIGELALLTELDLTKNQLRRLPNSLTTLPCLRFLNLSANLLEELPEDFGNLVLLDKLWCEHNKLTTLPASIGQSKARIANFNANLITELPDAISEMENLTALSVNMYVY